MRLTCPSCGARYDVPEGMLPAGGGHVQCTACHTRWYARGAGRPAALMSEEQILERLESRLAAAAGPGASDAGKAGSDAPEASEAGDPAHFDWEDPGTAAAVKPAATAGPAAAPPGPSDPAPRAAGGPGTAEAAAAAPATRRRRFVPGFLVGLGAVAVAALAYLEAGSLARRLPAAAPQIAAYAGAVDEARAWLDRTIAPLLPESG